MTTAASRRSADTIDIDRATLLIDAARGVFQFLANAAYAGDGGPDFAAAYWGGLELLDQGCAVLKQGDAEGSGSPSAGAG